MGGSGVSTKAPDFFALPLGYFCHAAEHRGVISFWAQGTKAKTKIFVQKLCDKHWEKYKNETQTNYQKIPTPACLVKADRDTKTNI